MQISASTFFGRRLLLYFVRTREPMLKADSLATVVIGMLRISQVILARLGKRGELFFRRTREGFRRRGLCREEEENGDV